MYTDLDGDAGRKWRSGRENAVSPRGNRCFALREGFGRGAAVGHGEGNVLYKKRQAGNAFRMSHRTGRGAFRGRGGS